MNEELFRPITEKVAEELNQTLSYPLKNVRIRLKKETKKGLFTTIIDLRSPKDGIIVAKKTDHSLEKSVQKAKQAIYKQISKLHTIKRKKAIHHFLRKHELVSELF